MFSNHQSLIIGIEEALMYATQEGHGFDLLFHTNTESGKTDDLKEHKSVNIGFINAFPDNSPGAYPGSNFGNACGTETYQVNGEKTLLQSSCTQIASDIIECQKTYGKKVFLSFGGAYPKNYYIASDSSARMPMVCIASSCAWKVPSRLVE